jgi:hypothetical protein
MSKINSSSFETISSRSKRWNINVSDNKNEFFSIIIAQILELMWLFFRGLRQNMFDQIAKLNWLFIVKHENLNSKSFLFKSMYAMSNFSLILLINYKYSIILFSMLCVSLFQMHSQVESIVSLTWTWKTSLTFWYLLHAWIN